MLHLRVMCTMEACMPSISFTCTHLLLLHHLLVFLKVWWLGGAPKCLTQCQKITSRHLKSFPLEPLFPYVAAKCHLRIIFCIKIWRLSTVGADLYLVHALSVEWRCHYSHLNVSNCSILTRQPDKSLQDVTLTHTGWQQPKNDVSTQNKRLEYIFSWSRKE